MPIHRCNIEIIVILKKKNVRNCNHLMEQDEHLEVSLSMPGMIPTILLIFYMVFFHNKLELEE